MVDTIKFSEMADGGDLANNEKVPGLLAGGNVLFNNPWTFLPPGTTADRPTPSAAINYRLRFNTDDQLYEYYDAVLGAWTQLQENSFTAGPFVIYETDPSFPQAQDLSLLADGILKQTVTLGVATIAIASNGNDYYGPGVIIPGEWGGTGVANTGLTIDLSGGATDYILTSDLSGNASWQPAGYLTDAVLLNPSGNQTINGNFTLTAYNMTATNNLIGGNLELSGNTLSSTNSNGNIQIVPNGTGSILTYSGSQFNSVYTTSFQSLMPIARARYNSGNGTNTGSFMGFASRAAAPGSFTALNVGDPMARLVAYGDDGSAFQEAGLLEWAVIGSVSSGIVPGQFLLYTTNSSGVRSQAMAIDNNQIMTLNNPLPPGSGGTGTASLPTAGQIPIGTSGNIYTPAAISSGTNILVANSSGSITINCIGNASLTWVDVTGTSATMSSNKGYIADNAGLVTLTLPTSSSQGDAISIIGNGAGGWTIAQASGQQIHVGSSASTLGAGGSVASTNRYDSINLICIVANTIWTTRGAPQSSGLTIV